MKRTFLLLMNQRKLIFSISFLIFILTIINFREEVIIEGQPLFLSPEELIAWVLGLFIGLLGMWYSIRRKNQS